MAILGKLPAAMTVVAITATLVGCGSSDIRDERDQARMERNEAQAELDQTQAERDQAQVDLARTQVDLAQAQADLAQAQTNLAQAQTNLEAAQAAAERLAVEKMKADKTAAAAEQARIEEEAARMTAEEERDAAQQALKDAQDAAAMKEAMAVSEAAKALLVVLADSEVNVESDGTTPVHTPPAPVVSVTIDGVLLAKATGYTMAEMAPDMVEGWRGATLTNAQGDTTVVYSDIGDDGTRSLLDRYNFLLPTATAPRRWRVNDATNTGFSTFNAGIPWSAVMRSDDMFTIDDSEEATAGSGGPILRFRGSVHDVPGTFSCAGNAGEDCQMPTRSLGDTVVPASGTDATDWTFVPDAGILTYTDDPTYLTLGWWLSKGANGKPDDLTLIGTATGLGDVRTATSTSGGTLRGSATYKGAAAGKYAMASATDTTYEGGHFTAMATMAVDFDVDDTPDTPAVNDRAGIALSGMIDNFMTGDVSRPDWMVKLMVDSSATTDGMQPVANLGSGSGGGLENALTTEWSTGSAQRGRGTWTAMFYGGDDDATNTALPKAAIGTFNAHIGTADADAGAVGRLQGAFSAHKVMDP